MSWPGCPDAQAAGFHKPLPQFTKGDAGADVGRRGAAHYHDWMRERALVRRWVGATLVLAAGVLGAPCSLAAAPALPALLQAEGVEAPWIQRLQAAIDLREQGLPARAVEQFDRLAADAQALAGPGARGITAWVQAEVGLTHLQTGRYAQAEAALASAVESLGESPLREHYRVGLGMALTARGQRDEARHSFTTALAGVPRNSVTAVQAGLELARLSTGSARRSALMGLRPLVLQLDAQDQPPWRMLWARLMRESGPQGLESAWRELDGLRRDAAVAASPRWRADTQEAMATLYEAAGRRTEALEINRSAWATASTLPESALGIRGVTLHAREGRLLRSLGQERAAMAAYWRAVEQIERIRQDLPIDDAEGRSIYATLLEPTYLSLLDLLLRSHQGSTPEAARQTLQRVVDTLELLKQSEMQDFLGDRCAVAELENGSGALRRAGVATLYTLSLPDRLELVLVTAAGLERRTVNVRREDLHKGVSATVERMREGSPGYLRMAQALYRWLWAPLEDLLRAQGVQEVVVVPDGVLRLLPFSALHDGKRHVLESYAVSTTTGLTMTNAAPSTLESSQVLVTGMSTPGRVVEKLSATVLDMVKAGESGSAQRALDGHALAGRGSAAPPPASEADLARLREDLKLPGVRDEVGALVKVVGGTTLLDEEFTVARFRALAETGDYRVIHIASHGMFGGSAATSFIMAHDDIVASDSLQSLLQSPRLQRHPIELLTLSACQTAEGNDRAPLGISGVAIRARAKSVLGTLWPVADEAARTLMTEFYGGLRRERLSKTQALRRAQLTLARDPKMAHPMFWSPFVLIGNWQ